MNRIGNKPILIPESVYVHIKSKKVFIEGPNGKLFKEFNGPIKIDLQSNKIVVNKTNNSRQASAMLGTCRSILQNLVTGVYNRYKKELKIKGVGFKAYLNNKILNLVLGYSHTIKYAIPNDINLILDQTGTKLIVEGTDKQLVGQVAATIKSYNPVEPYKGSGVSIVGEYIRHKESKKSG